MSESDQLLLNKITNLSGWGSVEKLEALSFGLYSKIELKGGVLEKW